MNAEKVRSPGFLTPKIGSLSKKSFSLKITFTIEKISVINVMKHNIVYKL